MAIKVSLRQKKINDGRKSLYLDFYPPIIKSNGKSSRREFLGLYIYEKPKNEIHKNHNLSTLNIANAIQQKRFNELNKSEIPNLRTAVFGTIGITALKPQIKLL